MKELISEIKKKKELSGLSDSFVKEILYEYLKKNKIERVSPGKSSKIIVKEVRAILRRYSGQFQPINKKARDELLEEGKIEELLNNHTSTKERMDFYPSLKEELSSLKPKSILDLGCGLNPLAIASKKITYYACDIQQAELDLVSKFFKLNGIKGKTFYCDLRNPGELPKVDVCLIFKVLDLLDSKGHKNVENLLSRIECKHLLVSFPTKKLSGKRMNQPRRYWFETMLESKKYKFRLIESPNEIFYVIKYRKI